jgi:hypothetical protein
VILGLRGRNVQADPKQCRKTNIPKSANDAAGNEVTFLSICGMTLYGEVDEVLNCDTVLL